MRLFFYFVSVNLTLHPYTLHFKFPFRIAHGVRTHTPAVFVELSLNGHTAYGEATLPPYLPYTQQSVIEALSKVDLSAISYPFDTRVVINDLLQRYTIEPPALAALDMALWSLQARLGGTTIAALLGVSEIKQPIRTYTIAMCDKAEMVQRIAHGRENGFTTFKLKLDGKNDAQMLADFRALSQAPFAVDANQAWSDIEQAYRFSDKLVHAGCLLIEQPFDKKDMEMSRKLRDHLPIPVIADEACQGPSDIARLSEAFSGVNIKLQKCGGITPAFGMIREARSLGMRVLIGCMSESVIGCGAAESLSPLCDWNDLDGPYLIDPVPFVQF